MAEWLAETIVSTETAEEAEEVAVYFAQRSWGVNPNARAYVLGAKPGLPRASAALFLALFCFPHLGRVGIRWVDGKAGK